jgi:hypothetical protein
MKIKAISFPVSSWVYAYGLDCSNNLFVWFLDQVPFRDHKHQKPRRKHRKGLGPCVLYKTNNGSTLYTQMKAAHSKGHFVWRVIPYHCPYTIVAPPSPPWQNQCADTACHLFLKANQSLTGGVFNALTWGQVDFGCGGWSLTDPITAVPVPNAASWYLSYAADLNTAPGPTVQFGYKINSGPIVGGTTYSPPPDGIHYIDNGDGTITINATDPSAQPISLNSGDVVTFYLKPSVNVTAISNVMGVSTIGAWVS